MDEYEEGNRAVMKKTVAEAAARGEASMYTLDLFTTFPKGKCLFDTDGGTDLYKAKELLGSKMAITGNIAPDLLAFGRPDDVYKTCRTQIEEMGDGYILAPSCSLSANMPKENLDAMYAAVG